MKYLCILALTIFVMSSFSQLKGQEMTGEHLNGVPYEIYQGPNRIDLRLIEDAESKLINYLRSAQEDERKKRILCFLSGFQDDQWAYANDEFVQVGASADEEHQARVGINYSRGAIRFTAYRNLYLISFNLPQEGRDPISCFFYLKSDSDGLLKVTDEVFMSL